MNENTIRMKLKEKYDIEMDYANKILYIHKPISVADFILVKKVSKDYKDVRVEPRNGIRW